jgi:hypothetical protein
MTDLTIRKRAAHRREVQSALQQILKDESVMPNIDCSDLVVSVSRVEFGRTVREIFIDVFGRSRHPQDPDGESSDIKYQSRARARGEEGYCDLTDVFVFPQLTEIVACELQRLLGLLYTPVIRRLCDIGRGKNYTGPFGE